MRVAAKDPPRNASPSPSESSIRERLLPGETVLDCNPKRGQVGDGLPGPVTDTLLETSPGQQLKGKQGLGRPLAVPSRDPSGFMTRTSCSSRSDGSIGEVTVSYLGQEKSYFKS